MAYTTLVFGFFLYLPASALLSSANWTERDPIRTFVSADKKYCAQAREQDANEALDMYKTMPRAKQYEESNLTNDASCEHLGYKFSGGVDPCHPGVLTFYRNQDEEIEFVKDYKQTLKDFGEMNLLTLDDVKLIDSCQCKNGSFRKDYQGTTCKKAYELQEVIENDPPRTFISSNKKVCAQARETVASEALDLYISMPRSKLYDGSVLNFETHCKFLGYNVSAGDDPCFPGVQLFYSDLESERPTMMEEINLMDTCKCKNGSFAKRFCDQTTAVQELIKRTTSEAKRFFDNVQRTFVSNNEQFCAQASGRVAEGALALYQAMPRGKMFDNSSVHGSDVKSCNQLGYTLDAGEDPCYPGLQIFHRNEEEKNKFAVEMDKTLKDFGSLYSLPLEDVNLMDSCSCHVDSVAAKYPGKACDRLTYLDASWIHHEPRFGYPMACASGPYVLATRALAVLKSAEPMHQNDQAAPIKCNELGYRFRPAQENNCFTGLRFWSTTKENKNTDMLNLATEGSLDNRVDEGYKNFTERLGIDMAIRTPNRVCHCAPNSAMGKNVRKTCDVESSHSQIRDWWKE